MVGGAAEQGWGRDQHALAWPRPASSSPTWVACHPDVEAEAIGLEGTEQCEANPTSKCGQRWDVSSQSPSASP